MTFEAKETSRFEGQPVDLYFFRYGAQPLSYFAYTNALQEVTLVDGGDAPGSVTYLPVTITRDRINSSGSLDKASLKIRAQRDLTIRPLFIIYPPSRVVNLTIRQGHLNDPDQEFLVCWAGRILSFEREDSEVVMAAEPISTSMRQPGLRRYYQIGCPHYLYGDDCRANRVAATVSGTVASIAGHTATLTGGWNAQPFVKYRQGEFRWTLASGEIEIRTILRVDTNTLTLSGPLTGLAATDSVEVSLGCNHQTSPLGVGDGDCVNLHSNGPNFGGCKWIPKKNPIRPVNGFY